MKTFIRIISVMVLTYGFAYAQDVVESEAVSAAVRFVSELKQTNWTNDSVSNVKTFNLDNRAVWLLPWRKS